MIIAIITVCVFALLALWLYWDHKKQTGKVRQPVEAEGKIVDFAKLKQTKSGFINTIASSDEDLELIYPVVRFVLQGAKGVKFRDRKGFKEDEVPFAIGQNVKVVYDKNNPLVAEIIYN